MKTAGLDMTGEIALVTGGGTGIGLAIASALAGAGARVVLVGRRKEVLAQAASALGPLAACYAHDVTDLAQAPALVERVAREVGPVSVLVNNAGTNLKKAMLETTDAEFHAIMATHVEAGFALARAVVPGMTRGAAGRGRGSILFIASMASLFGIPGVVAYSAAKSALLGMVHTMALELGPAGIRVNAIAPGWIDSDMTRQAMSGDERRRSKVLSRTPLQRFGAPEEVGAAALFLCSPAASFITGVCLPVDGGVAIGF